MFSARLAPTAGWPLEKVVSILRESPTVHGLLAIGSTGRGERNHSSDIDLVIVIEAGRGGPRLALSVIDGGVADVLFVAVDQLKHWPVSGGSGAWPAETLGRWLRSGRILFDRSGLLADAQQRALNPIEHSDTDVIDRYATWFSINYNLVQNRRMAGSADSVYTLALELRLLYSLNDLWQAYFRLRCLTQRGEKDQIRHLQVSDPDYLRLFQAALRATDARERVALSEELASRCLEPVGGVWPPGFACVLPWSDSRSDDNLAAAWVEWEALFGVS